MKTLGVGERRERVAIRGIALDAGGKVARCGRDDMRFVPQDGRREAAQFGLAEIGAAQFRGQHVCERIAE